MSHSLQTKNMTASVHSVTQLQENNRRRTALLLTGCNCSGESPGDFTPFSASSLISNRRGHRNRFLSASATCHILSCVSELARFLGLVSNLSDSVEAMVSYCPICGKPVYFGEKKRSLGRDYHPLCLKCHKCKRQLTPGQHAEHDEKPYCTNCYLRDFGPRGTRTPAPRPRSTATS